MKYLIAILLISVLAITACAPEDVDIPPEDPIIGDEDDADDEAQEDILSDLVDEDEDIEIGEMI